MSINRNRCSWLIALCGLCLITSLAWGDDRSITPQESDGSRSETNDGAKYSKDGTMLLSCPKDVKSFTIPSSVTKIGEGAFRDCGSLASITIPPSVTEIG
ncbi:MAG: leucine-rich repeat protein, partial [Thermoguttaceae bacterium]|nr:leucine-rich repeat protein [Thermoguttaceae bacterium]